MILQEKISKNMSNKSGQANGPRKFSEKIALLKQKEAESTANFEVVMRDVSTTPSQGVLGASSPPQEHASLTPSHPVSEMTPSPPVSAELVNMSTVQMRSVLPLLDIQQHQQFRPLPISINNSTCTAHVTSSLVAMPTSCMTQKTTSLPNVCQVVNNQRQHNHTPRNTSTIDLKSALYNLERIKSGREMLVDHLKNRFNRQHGQGNSADTSPVREERTRSASPGQPERHRPRSDQYHHRSPYSNPYLSPPPVGNRIGSSTSSIASSDHSNSSIQQDSWRRVLSDSAIQHSLLDNTSLPTVTSSMVTHSTASGQPIAHHSSMEFATGLTNNSSINNSTPAFHFPPLNTTVGGTRSSHHSQQQGGLLRQQPAQESNRFFPSHTQHATPTSKQPLTAGGVVRKRGGGVKPVVDLRQMGGGVESQNMPGYLVQEQSPLACGGTLQSVSVQEQMERFKMLGMAQQGPNFMINGQEQIGPIVSEAGFQPHYFSQQQQRTNQQRQLTPLDNQDLNLLHTSDLNYAKIPDIILTEPECERRDSFTLTNEILSNLGNSMTGGNLGNSMGANSSSFIDADFPLLDISDSDLQILTDPALLDYVTDDVTEKELLQEQF